MINLILKHLILLDKLRYMIRIKSMLRNGLNYDV